MFTAELFSASILYAFKIVGKAKPRRYQSSKLPPLFPICILCVGSRLSPQESFRCIAPVPILDSVPETKESIRNGQRNDAHVSHTEPGNMTFRLCLSQLEFAS